eukprot:322380_1
MAYTSLNPVMLLLNLFSVTILPIPTNDLDTAGNPLWYEIDLYACSGCFRFEDVYYNGQKQYEFSYNENDQREIFWSSINNYWTCYKPNNKIYWAYCYKSNLFECIWHDQLGTAAGIRWTIDVNDAGGTYQYAQQYNDRFAFNRTDLNRSNRYIYYDNRLKQSLWKVSDSLGGTTIYDTCNKDNFFECPFVSTGSGSCSPGPTTYPTPEPTMHPTPAPTYMPTPKPTNKPTQSPTPTPTMNPTPAPTGIPTIRTANPTITPTSSAINSTKSWNYIIVISTVATLSICITIIIFYAWTQFKPSHKYPAQQKQNNYNESLLEMIPETHETPQHETQQYKTPFTSGFDCVSTITSGSGELDESYVNEMELLDNDEIGEDDYDGDYQQLYAKPNKNELTSGNDHKIMHFYYKDYVKQPDSDNENDKLYHEKQKWELCLMHALNGLLQKPIFTVSKMNEICKELAPNKLINPHKSIFQTGNYDANVLMMALGKMDIKIQWFDSRKVKELDLNNEQFWNILEPENHKFVGFILNYPLSKFKMLSRRHWIAIKMVYGIWYNLDSKLKVPKNYKNANELNQYLVRVLKEDNAQLIICRKSNSNNPNKIMQVEVNVPLDW